MAWVYQAIHGGRQLIVKVGIRSFGQCQMTMHLSASEFSLGPQLRRQARAYGAPRRGFGLDRPPWPSGSADRADGKFTRLSVPKVRYSRSTSDRSSTGFLKI